MTVYQRAVLGQVWVDYTPTLGAWTLGAGTLTCRYMRYGSGVFVEDRIVFGAGMASSTSAPTLTLPTPAVSGSSGLLWFEGTYQLSASTTFIAMRWRSQGGSDTIGMIARASTAYLSYVNLTSSLASPPFTPVSGSVMTRRGFYEEA